MAVGNNYGARSGIAHARIATGAPVAVPTYMPVSPAGGDGQASTIKRCRRGWYRAKLDSGGPRDEKLEDADAAIESRAGRRWGPDLSMQPNYPTLPPFQQPREGEHSLRLQIDGLKGFAIFMLDQVGRVATWNAGAQRFQGYEAAEIVGKDFSCFFPTEDVVLGRPQHEIIAAARDGHFEDEGWRLRKDGSKFWANVILTALRDPQGNLIGFGMVIRDITERKRSVEQFRLAIEAAPTGMLMMDHTGAIVLVNAQVEKLFGYPRSELLGKRIEVLVPTRFRARHPDFRNAFLADPKARAMGGGRELYGLRRDGSEIPIEIGLNPLQTPEGDFVLSSVVDITERKRSVEQFRLAIEAAPTGMLMMDDSGAIVLVNAQIEKLFGYPRAELLGQQIELLVPERFRRRHPGFREIFFGDPKARAMGGGRELHGLRKDGTEVPIEIGLNPLRTSEGNFVLSSVVDITERKRADEERENLLGQLQALNADLEQRVTARTAELSATLREREVLLQEIHHRVKNNLQVISSLINMQVRQLADDSSRDALEECQTRVQAIALIHEQLYQSQDYSRVPFSAYARSLAANIFAATGISPTAVSLQLDMEDMALGVDKAIPCGLILNELITNALKHAFPRPRQGQVRVQLRKDGNSAALSVGDNGVGMPEQFNLKDSSSLGLSLVYTLVEQLDGQVRIIRGSGTTFLVTFPMGSDP
jgi:PAS domain S-box-containing protein